MLSTFRSSRCCGPRHCRKADAMQAGTIRLCALSTHDESCARSVSKTARWLSADAEKLREALTTNPPCVASAPRAFSQALWMLSSSFLKADRVRPSSAPGSDVISHTSVITVPSVKLSSSFGASRVTMYVPRTRIASETLTPPF